MGGEGFTVGYFHIEWRDADTIQIVDTRSGDAALIHGGDFEGVLSGIAACAGLTARALQQ